MKAVAICLMIISFASALPGTAAGQGTNGPAVERVDSRTSYTCYMPFQKKSKKGIATPKPDIDLIKTRLKVAEEDHKACKAQRGRNR